MTAALPEEGLDYEEADAGPRGPEPSMEEILASIRAIITDDRASAAARAVTAAEARSTQSAAPQVIYSQFGPSKPTADTLRPALKDTLATPTVVWSRPLEPVPQRAVELETSAPAAPYAPAAQEAPLLSEEADRAVTASFHALAASLALPTPERLEAVAKDMLKPMLKAWLDDNLPGLVERLVRVEIQRVARGGR